MDAIELIKKDIKHLHQIITIYKEDLEEANKILVLSGKRIDIANAEHSGWSNYFYQKKVEVKHIREYIQSKVNEVHGELWVKYTESMNIMLTQKDKEQYIRRTPEYLNINELYLAINELYEQYERVLDAFEKRGYCLNNLTRLVVANNNDWVIP